MDELRAALTTATPSRLLMVAHALRQNIPVDEVCALSHFDPWFVRQIKEIVDTEALVAARGLPDARSHAPCQSHGFSDARLGELSGTDEDKVRAVGTSWTFTPISAALTPAPPNLPPVRPIFIQAMTRLRLLRNKPSPSRQRAEGRHSGRRAEPHRSGH